jgi:para-aminobenzoate synthetase
MLPASRSLVRILQARGAVVKTLLLDNYDSFTFNLYQALAQVNGEPPIVARNDWDWDELRQLAYDNIVISPGPGRPDRSADFGICRRAIEEAEVPVLGVCLGHQGIGTVHGATLALAPTPMHGRASRIHHDESALFRGIPQGVEVVRYHSFMLAELPVSMERIAWTADGLDSLIMACRHRTRPQWGVQFHPESIGTEHGARLLANFRDLTRERAGARPGAQGRRHARAEARTPAAPRAAGTGRYELHVRRLDVYPDPERVFVDLYGNKAASFWLDSSLETAGARFHFMGDAGGPLAAVVRYQVRGQRLEILRGNQREVRNESIFSYLARELAELGDLGEPETSGDLAAPALPCELACGYVGYFGYELKAECGGDDAHQATTPDAWLVRADRLLIFDAAERRLYLSCLAERGAAAQARQWLEDVEQRLATLRPLPAVRTLPAAPRFGLARDRDGYLVDIDACLRQIHLGESYEVCLTNRIEMDADIPPLDYYRVLRRVNPAPYAAFLHLGDVCVACSSPERFLRVDRAGWVESRPIKGTLPRGRTAERDAALRERLRTSEKDRSEHLMIVDLVRNDLGRVCEVGSVHVPGFMDVESYATVHQMVSTIRGKLREDATAVDCVRAAFPGGSMTGAPKIRTMRIIDALEPGARGIYSGAIGWLGAGGAADLAIVIRTAVLEPQRATMGVGGAIVALSRPDAELDELLLKGQALMKAAMQMAPPADDPAGSS